MVLDLEIFLFWRQDKGHCKCVENCVNAQNNFILRQLMLNVNHIFSIFNVDRVGAQLSLDVVVMIFKISDLSRYIPTVQFIGISNIICSILFEIIF